MCARISVCHLAKGRPLREVGNSEDCSLDFGSHRNETLSLSRAVPTNRMHDSATDLYLGQCSETFEYFRKRRTTLLIAQPNGFAPGPDSKFAGAGVARVIPCEWRNRRRAAAAIAE